jgi:hypothetical protein
MSQYMLSVHNIEGQPMPAPDVMQQMFVDVEAFNQELRDTGAWVFTCGLHPADTATVVQAKNGEVLITDGRSPRRRSTWAASGSSRSPTSTQRSRWPAGQAPHARARSKYVRSNPNKGFLGGGVRCRSGQPDLP